MDAFGPDGVFPRAAAAVVAVGAGLLMVRGTWDGVYFARTDEAVRQAAQGLLLLSGGAATLMAVAAAAWWWMRRRAAGGLLGVPALLTASVAWFGQETLFPPFVAVLGCVPIGVGVVLLMLPPPRGNPGSVTGPVSSRRDRPR